VNEMPSPKYQLELKLSPRLAVRFEKEWPNIKRVVCTFTEDGASLEIDGRKVIDFQIYKGGLS
jgi:hypothetical protein